MGYISDMELEEVIIAEIRRRGPLNFEDFMNMALYHPRLGYYSGKLVPVGKSGDFYTAPHVHAIFGALIGRQLEEMWLALGRPRRFTAVEIGAGRGFLARDLLDFLKPSVLYQHLEYLIVERNPFNRVSQQKLLREHAGKATWAAALPELEPFCGCLLSNELLDAFPVRLVETGDDAGDGLCEIFVDTGDGGFQEVRRPAGPEVKKYLAEFAPSLDPGYRTEVNLRVRDWLADVHGKLERGFILTVDYGFSAAEFYQLGRNRGTLLCYHGHEAGEDPFVHVGRQDITAHINFSALKSWGETFGMRTLGYASQGPYLVALGIDRLIHRYAGNPPDPMELTKIKQLFMPQGLGESHKVMVQYKGDGKPELKGFSLRNEMDRL